MVFFTRIGYNFFQLIRSALASEDQLHVLENDSVLMPTNVQDVQEKTNAQWGSRVRIRKTYCLTDDNQGKDRFLNGITRENFLCNLFYDCSFIIIENRNMHLVWFMVNLSYPSQENISFTRKYFPSNILHHIF